jgi:phosphonate degradation associated HDIG domain protein
MGRPIDRRVMMDIIDDIFSLFAKYGDRGYGEDVNQREHALQAAHFAGEAGEPDTLIAAALLHDVGQFLNEAGELAEREGRDARHEMGGAELLSRYFPESVVDPIRLHVAAKRYLCAIDPAYHDALSAASQLSLRLQGGPFTPPQADAFTRLPHAAEAIRLRRYDDLGKQRDFAVQGLEDYRPLLERVLL